MADKPAEGSVFPIRSVAVMQMDNARTLIAIRLGHA